MTSSGFFALLGLGGENRRGLPLKPLAQNFVDLHPEAAVPSAGKPINGIPHLLGSLEGNKCIFFHSGIIT